MEIVGLASQDKRSVSEARDTGPQQTLNLADNRSWLVLLLMLGLFASLGFNLYLGWIAWDIHGRYQDAIADLSERESDERDVVSLGRRLDRKRDHEAERHTAHA
jgi:hypothetical protein